jgi:RNA polymerase sigma-70 factor, ECF subfamily
MGICAAMTTASRSMDREEVSRLVGECQAGSRDAFARLYAEYRDRVFTIAVSYFRGNREAAEDVMQTVFTNLLDRIGQFHHDAEFTTWLYRTVSNACTDEFRRRRRFLPWSDVEICVEQSSESEVSERHAVASAVEQLSPKLRMPILLKYYEDLSYQEIAEILGCSMGTVASRMNRAHQALAKLLGEERYA